MSAASERILVTGGTGFIGKHVLKQFLERGAYLRIVVRSHEKGEGLKSLFPEYTQQMEFAIVENIEAPDAYDNAVQGVTRIVHMASPLAGSSQLDNEHAYLIPARDGVVNLLKSASKSESVKRVVITSSFASVVDRSSPRNAPRTWTEQDWNPLTWEEGKAATNPLVAYAVSKKYAEVAAWEFMQTENPHFDLIALNPPGVFGKPVETVNSLTDLSGSSAIFLKTLDPKAAEIGPTWSPFYIDVRDVALAHVKATYADASAGNQRYLLAGPGFGTNKMVYDYVKKRYPNRHIAPLSKEAEAEDIQQRFDASKAERVFGIKFRTFEELLHDYTDFVFSYDN